MTPRTALSATLLIGIKNVKPNNNRIMRKCWNCKIEKEYTCFHKSRILPGGIAYICKPCWQEKYGKTDARKKASSSWIKKNKQKARAHNKVGWALEKGTLVKELCEQCGDKSTQAHHDDYTKPLEVRWLCKPCHDDWHRNNKPVV